MNETANALATTAGAAGDLIGHGPMPWECDKKLKKLGDFLPDQHHRWRHRPMHLIAKVLMDTAEAVRSADPENLRTQAYYLDEIIAAIEKAKAAETAQNS